MKRNFAWALIVGAILLFAFCFAFGGIGTADQFGYALVVVVSLNQSAGRYRKGPQREVDGAFAELAAEMNCHDLVVV